MGFEDLGGLTDFSEALEGTLALVFFAASATLDGFGGFADFDFVTALDGGNGTGGAQPRLGASSVPRQFLLPHQHGYSALSFFV